MRIGMVLLDKRYPPDIRVDKEARSLAAAGHEVRLLTLRAPGDPESETSGPIMVRRVRPLPRIANAIATVIYRAGGFSPHPYFHSKVKRFLRDEEIEVLHVHDLLFALPAGRAAMRLGIPWVLDLHENYPEQAKELDWRPDLLLFTPRRLSRAERKALRLATAAVTESPEGVEFLSRKHSLPPGGIVAVPNYEDAATFTSIPVDEDIVERYSGGTVLLYMGIMMEQRGLDEVLEALAIARKEVPDLRLLLVGQGPHMEALIARARKLGVSEHVDFIDWVPFEQVPSFIRAADIGLAPSRALTYDAHTSLYHKLFQYMLMGRPVIAADVQAMARIIRDSGCGVLYQPGNATDLARAISSLSDPALREEMGERGRKAAEGPYDWSASEGLLLSVYDELEKRFGIPSSS